MGGIIRSMYAMKSSPNVAGRYIYNIKYPSLTFGDNSTFMVVSMTSGINLSNLSCPNACNTSARPIESYEVQLVRTDENFRVKIYK